MPPPLLTNLTCPLTIAGIGLGIARRLGQEGAKVVVSSRKASAVEETVRQLRSEGIDVVGTACHVGDTAQLQSLVDFTVQHCGPTIDVLVSNAAVNPAAGPILDLPESAIDKILDLNVKSAIMLTRAVRPHMRAGASIVYISSYSAFAPSAPIAMYAVSKTALLGLTKALAEELGPDQIRVNCIAPGAGRAGECLQRTPKQQGPATHVASRCVRPARA